MISNFKFQISNSERGVSLIITFFITIIILFVVLAISTILYSEIKVIRNIGNSVVAFYAADSGVEKVLYFDRKEIPEVSVRGICNICDDTACESDCSDCSTTGTDCLTCTDCRIAFKTTIGQKKYYNVAIDVSLLSQEECGISQGYVQSYGTYSNTTRAIGLDMTKQAGSVLGPSITGATAVPNANGNIITISAYVDKSVDSVTAYIYDEYQNLIDQVSLQAGGTGHWSKPWQPPVIGATYYISISAIDSNGYCTSITIISG